MTSASSATVWAHAPGRVNLIGDHTDHAGGVALPIAIDLGTTITGTRGGDTIDLRSDRAEGQLRLPVPVGVPVGSDAALDIDALQPSWGRYVAAVAELLGASVGFVGEVHSDLPLGAGLSSSASLEVSAALALGAEVPRLDLARLAQAAEVRAVGVPCGLLDQLSSTFGVADHALLIDFRTLAIIPVPLPADCEIVVVHSGQERTLAGSAYAERRAACEAATDVVGALPSASLDDLSRIADPIVRRRALHVVTECARVHAAVAALRDGDLPAFGARMVESHASLRDDFEVSTPTLDALVDRLLALPGVHGARLTGAGFGGCVVAVTEPGAIGDAAALTGRGWKVRAVGPASVQPLHASEEL